MAQVYNADDPNLRRFDKAGGKLIIYHGWADPLITPGGTVNYVRDAMARSGGREATQDFMRLFLLPGVYHCSGGPGEDTVDWLTQIQKWVEQGQAPDEVTASKVARGGTVTSTRVCPSTFRRHCKWRGRPASRSMRLVGTHWGGDGGGPATPAVAAAVHGHAAACSSAGACCSVTPNRSPTCTTDNELSSRRILVRSPSA